MLLILDTNEYIYTFGVMQKPSCALLLSTLTNPHSGLEIRISRTIVNEVKRNLVPEIFQEFMGFISELTTIDEDFLIPFELGAKYETKGLKSADAFIAAYTEWSGADILVTENRHFLSRQNDLPFKVLTAEKCLKLLKISLR